MRRRATWVVCLASTLLFVACDPSTDRGSDQSPDPSSSSPTVTPSAVSVPTRPSPIGFTYMTFSSEQAPINWPRDMWYFDFLKGSSTRLTTDGGFKYRPRLRNSDTVGYIQDDTLFEVSLSSRVRREVLREDGIEVFAWSRSGSDLAYATLSEVTLARRGSKPSVIRRLPRYEGGGRGGGDQDEQYMAWSPNGRMLLVQQTQLCCTAGAEARSLFVIGLDGKDLVSPLRATFARWSPDSRRIYATELFVPKARVFSVDVATGTITFLKTRRDVFNLAVSPDGALLAYDGGGADPSTFVYDLRTRKERRLASGVMPLWIDRSNLIVTNVRKCSNTGSDICGGHAGIPWHPTGRCSIISLAGDAPRVLRAHWTYDAALVVPAAS